MTAWQRCRDLGLSEIEFMELTTHIETPALERLPEDKLWLIPLCIIQIDRLCKMRFMYQSLDDFVDLVHNGTMLEISEAYASSSSVVDPWMGLLIEESKMGSMDKLLYRDWNMEKPVIALTGQSLQRRAGNYLLAATTSNAIKILYPLTMVGPVSTLMMDRYTGDNTHELLTRVWHEFRKSQSNSRNDRN